MIREIAELISTTVLSDLISRANDKLLGVIRTPRFSTLRTHYSEIREKLSKMPFLYENLTADVLTNFVEITIDTLDLTTLQVRSPERGQLSTEQRIKTRHRALFLGNAGIGKTTFFRYIALSLIDKKIGIQTFIADDSVVPFYVPLKAVDNTAPSPIATYLLRSYRFLAGNHGRSRLLNLARQRRILLLLDGYDEIYVPPEDQKNFILEELDLLFASGHTSVTRSASHDLQELYSLLKTCRIWLSSRKEFYQQHPLDLDEDKVRRAGNLDFVALTLKGLGNRAPLIKSIFDLYRARGERYRDNLNEESLLHDIDRSADDSLIALSFNPLFLTMMCYIYAQSALSSQHLVKWPSKNMSELIEACVDVLLIDKDEDKVRGLEKNQHGAFRKRRLLYPEEKRLFLNYFACHLLISGLSLFQEEDIVSAAIYFFNKEYNGIWKEEILRSLESKSRNYHSFHKQLLNQGIFVLVEKSEGGARYDFPHRRFREVLAACYLDTPEKLADLLANLGNRNYSEFLYVFFSISRFQDAILQELLSRVDASAEGYFYGTLVYNCLQRKPKLYDPSHLLIEFIEEKMRVRTPFHISKNILLYVQPTPSFFRWIELRLRQGLHDGDEHAVAVAGPLLIGADKSLAKGILRSEAQAAMSHESLTGLFLKLTSEIGLKDLKGYLSACRKKRALFYKWCYAFLTYPGLSTTEAASVYRELDLRDRIAIVAISHLHKANSLWGKMYQFTEEIELLSSLVRHIRTTKPEANQGDSGLYVLTSSIIGRINEEPTRERLRPLSGKVMFDPGVLVQMLPADRIDLIKLAKRDKSIFAMVQNELKGIGPELVIPSYFY